MSFDLEIREQIACYVAGEIAAPELEAWVSGEMWDVEGEPLTTQQLAHDVLRLTSEAANGDWTDAELRERLGILSRTYWFQQAPKLAISSSDAKLIRHGQQKAATEISLVEEPA